MVGAEIKTKEQQVCRAGEFLVAEIDAKLGGYGLVPDSLDGAIVSSHYFLFGVNDAKLDRDSWPTSPRHPRFSSKWRLREAPIMPPSGPHTFWPTKSPCPPCPSSGGSWRRSSSLRPRSRRLTTSGIAALVKGGAFFACQHGAAFSPTENWKVVALEETCAEIIDCPHSNPVYSDDGVPTLRSPDVGWGRLDLDGARRTSEGEYQPEPGVAN